MILIKTIDHIPPCCSECELCDTYCLLLRRSFDAINPNEDRLAACPMVDVFLDEDGVVHAVK